MKYLWPITLILLLSACSDTKEQTKENSKAIEKTTPKQTLQVAEKPKPLTKEVKVKSEPKITQPLKKEPIPEEVVVKEVSQPLPPKKTAPLKEAPKSIHPPLKKVQVDAKALFSKCSACHGQKAQMHALGKSQIIQGWDAKKIATAIYGYQDGSYGGAMKAAMKGQVKDLNDAEIKALSDYISKL